MILKIWALIWILGWMYAYSFLFWQSFWLGWIVGSWPLFWALFVSFVLGTAYSIDVSWLCLHIYYYSDSSYSCMVQLSLCYHDAMCIRLLLFLNHIQCCLRTRNAKANLTNFRIFEPLLSYAKQTLHLIVILYNYSLRDTC